MLVNSRTICVGCSRLFFGQSPTAVVTLVVRRTQRRHASSVPGSSLQVHVPKDRLVPQDSELAQPLQMEDLPRAQQRYVKQFEEINYIRIKEIFKRHKKNIFGFIFLTCMVVSIYFYTMHAVKQETFLEEIDQEVAEEKGEVVPAAATTEK